MTDECVFSPGDKVTTDFWAPIYVGFHFTVLEVKQRRGDGRWTVKVDKVEKKEGRFLDAGWFRPVEKEDE